MRKIETGKIEMLRKLRKQGLTQKQVAEKLGLSISSIRKYEIKAKKIIVKTQNKIETEIPEEDIEEAVEVIEENEEFGDRKSKLVNTIVQLLPEVGKQIAYTSKIAKEEIKKEIKKEIEKDEELELEECKNAVKVVLICYGDRGGSYPRSSVMEALVKTDENLINFELRKGLYIKDESDVYYKIKDVDPEGSYISQKTKIVVEKLKKKPLKIELPIKVTLDDIIGQEKAKQSAIQIIENLKKPDKFGKFRINNAVFYGSQGIGKTMLAQAIAEEAKKAGATVIEYGATELIKRYAGASSEKINEVFKAARTRFERTKKMTIIIINEFDAIALDRDNQRLRGDVNEFIGALAPAMETTNYNKGYITVLTTNRLDLFDEAIKGRCDIREEFKLPDVNERAILLERCLKDSPIKINANYKKISEHMKDLSYRDIQWDIIGPLIREGIVEEKKELTIQDFKRAIEKFRSEVGKPPEVMYK